jgi:hypothetical protein
MTTMNTRTTVGMTRTVVGRMKAENVTRVLENVGDITIE